MARLLLRTADPATGTVTTVLREAEAGRSFLAQRQDLVPVLEQAKADAGEFTAAAVRRNPAKIRRVASIPNVVVLQLKAAGIWGDRKALLRWLSDVDNRAFRVDDGRSLS